LSFFFCFISLFSPRRHADFHLSPPLMPRRLRRRASAIERRSAML